MRETDIFDHMDRDALFSWLAERGITWVLTPNYSDQALRIVCRVWGKKPTSLFS